MVIFPSCLFICRDRFIGGGNQKILIELLGPEFFRLQKKLSSLSRIRDERESDGFLYMDRERKVVWE